MAGHRWRSRSWKSGAPSPKSRKRIFFFVLAVIMLFSLQSFIFIEKNLSPPLMNLSQIRLKQLATQSINTAISDRIAQVTNFDKLIEWKTYNNGRITGFVLNYAEYVKITSDTTNRVQSLMQNMKHMNESIPLGQALGSSLLASFGPQIPIRLVPAGAVKVDLSTRYQNVGINMVLVEVYARIVVEVTILIPFDSKPEIVETELPISYILVAGDTPMYYMDNKGNPVGHSAPLPPSISLPNLKMGAMADPPANPNGAEAIGRTDVSGKN